MDLRKLRHAVALEAEGNFARAARRLNVTQPTLTRSIQSLERSLGLKLFDRLTTGVKPTADGLRILHQARAMLRLEGSLRREASLLSKGETGRVAFGLGPMLAPLLQSVLETLLLNGKGLELSIHIDAPDNLQALLLREEIDFFVSDSRHATRSDELTIQSLGQVPVRYYVRAGHPLAALGSDLTPSDLADFPLAVSKMRHNTFTRRPSSNVVLCDDACTLKQIGKTSDAVVLGIDLAMEPELTSGDIVSLRLAVSEDPTARIAVVEHLGRTRTTVADRIISNFAMRLPHGADEASAVGR